MVLIRPNSMCIINNRSMNRRVLMTCKLSWVRSQEEVVPQQQQPSWGMLVSCFYGWLQEQAGEIGVLCLIVLIAFNSSILSDFVRYFSDNLSVTNRAWSYIYIYAYTCNILLTINKSVCCYQNMAQLDVRELKMYNFVSAVTFNCVFIIFAHDLHCCTFYLSLV